MPRVFYSHSVALFGSIQEAQDVALLEALGFEVVNPNCPEHCQGYVAHGMTYYGTVIATCDALAFRSLTDFSLPAGVAKEIAMAIKFGAPVFELPQATRPVLTEAQTKEFLTVTDRGHHNEHNVDHRVTPPRYRHGNGPS